MGKGGILISKLEIVPEEITKLLLRCRYCRIFTRLYVDGHQYYLRTFLQYEEEKSTIPNLFLDLKIRSGLFYRQKGSFCLECFLLILIHTLYMARTFIIHGKTKY